MPKLIDLTGQKFGKLTVIARDYETQKIKHSKDVFWKCKCDCGNIVSSRGHDLKQNKILSCGCLKKENARNINYKDLTGQRFGKLLVTYQCDYQIDQHNMWHCVCDCGNEKDIMGKHLLSGATTSCGCIKSAGELKISKILKELNIDFENQKVFPSCRNVLPLSFDFYLPQYNLLIEYNGIQHYEPNEFFGGENKFFYQQQNDRIKQEWCQKNSIKLLVISYLEYPQLNKEYLKNLIQGE